ncbi:Kelch repeat type [Salix suchowensis]|nr:Kelch repeat type [Salix suchowensis]
MKTRNMITFMIWRKQKNFDTWILFQNLLLLFAGGKSSLACPRGISLAEVYDPALDEWKALPDMSTTRYKCVGVTWQGKIHVVGGFAENVDIESYGGKLNSWILSSPISTLDAAGPNRPPCQRLYLTVAPIKTRLYFLAGYRMPREDSRSISVVHVFDTSANGDRWKSLVENTIYLICHS